MEPTATPAPLPDNAPPAVLGELVVGNGRLIGTRRALTGPLTLIGDGTGCDVRLHNDKVAPFHCVLFHGPQGFVLRNLGGLGATLVNGVAVETCPLSHGDLIEVGPYHLVLELPGGAQEAEAPSLDAERDALRIQAAAVVAQQAALTEEELRLQQRRGGLERQEEQLANHLEEKRRQLVEQREQIKTERDAFKEERAEKERKLAARHEEAENAFAEADEERKLSQKERARFIELRKRLKRRWEQHFEAHEAELRKRAQQLTAEADRLAGEFGKLERGHAVLGEQRLQYNGEMELGRRQLAEAWEELSLSQQDWEICLNREKTTYEQRAHELAERERKVAREEQELADDKRRREQIQAQREKEAEGLEKRIRHQRGKLQTLEKTLANLDTAAQSRRLGAIPPSILALPPAVAPDLASERGEAPVVLKRLAGCLADQRLHLLEQWRGVLDVQNQWQRQREEILTELEDSGNRLAEREQRIGEREKELTGWAGQLEQRQEALSHLCCSLEGRQARMKADAQEWEAERSRVLAEARASEELATVRVQRMAKLGRRTIKRLVVEAELLRDARLHCEETRKQYAVLWEECRARTEVLLREQQSVASETLALEGLRLEMLGKAENAAAAEKRLDKLRRQSQALVERGAADLEREREALRTEVGRCNERSQALRQDEEHIVAWRRKLAKRQRKWDQRTSAGREEEQQRVQEMQRLIEQHDQDAKHLRELREEVERIARLMMDEAGNAPSSPIAA